LTLNCKETECEISQHIFSISCWPTQRDGIRLSGPTTDALNRMTSSEYNRHPRNIPQTWHPRFKF